jgi:hypothetical protein
MIGAALGVTLLAIIVIGCGGSKIEYVEADASIDAAASIDASVDGTVPPTVDASDSSSFDASPAALLAPCAAQRDVYYYDVETYDGTFEAGAETFTNLDSSWNAQLTPELEIMVLTGGSGGEVDVWVPDGQQLAPGTYPQGPQTANVATSLDLYIGDEGCAIASGTFTIVDVTTSTDDAGDQTLQSFLAWFNVECVGYHVPIPVVGCIGYSVSR